MVSIPTDDVIAPITAEDMEPTNVPSDTTIQQTTKKRKGRQPYPRDENGNIIRPAGWIPPSQRRKGSELDEEQEKLELRRQRRERYAETIRKDVNPFLLDIGSMLTSLPKQALVQQRGNDFFLTPLGEQVAWNETQIRVHSTTLARLQETERGQQLLESLEGISPYAFLGLSGLMLLMWFMGMMSLRQMQITRLKAALSGEGAHTESKPETNGQAPTNFMDMVASFMQKNTKAPEPVVEQEEVVPE